MIDSHVHLDADQYADPSRAIKRALEAGVTAMVAPGTGGASNRCVLDLAHRFPRVVYAACGYHPERLELTEADLEEALTLIRAERVRSGRSAKSGYPGTGSAHGNPNGSPGRSVSWHVLPALPPMPTFR